MNEYTVFTVLTILGVLGGVFLFYLYQQRKHRIQTETNSERMQILRIAETEYQEKLSELKIDPSNTEVRENALEFGREYARITRLFQGINGISVVDEVAIMNDINAACASSLSIQNKQDQSFEPAIEHRLKKLSELKAKNLINDQEFNEIREKILNEV